MNGELRESKSKVVRMEGVADDQRSLSPKPQVLVPAPLCTVYSVRVSEGVWQEPLDLRKVPCVGAVQQQ